MSNSNIVILKRGQKLGPLQEREMEETRVEIVLKDWSKHSIGKACQKVEKWNAEELDLSMNAQPIILKTIRLIAFPRLVHLDLRGNKIESVQSLCRLEMHKLEYLCLSHNLITNIRSIRKANWPSLDRLSLTHNKWIKERSNFFNQYQTVLQLKTTKNISIWEINTLRSLAFVVKCNCKQLTQTNLRWVFIGEIKYELIDEKSIKKCLNRKWKKQYFKI